MGSPSYMSPEQLKSTKEVDHRADVWSLGAVLYEAITGKPAFRGESLPQVCAMIASEDPALPSTRRDGIPIELERTVLRCLDKDPETRATLVELARTLASYAPDRAKASLERIEATAGTAEPRPRAATYADRGRADGPSSSTRTRLGDVAGASERGGRTMSSWGRDRRGRRGGGGAILLLLAASGLAAVAVYTGRLGVVKLQGDLAGASSAVSSAANAVSSAAGAVSSAVTSVSSAVSSVSSAVASSLPPLPPLPGITDEPAASASAAPSASPRRGRTSDQDEDEPAATGKPERDSGPAGASGRAEGAREADAPRKDAQASLVRRTSAAAITAGRAAPSTGACARVIRSSYGDAVPRKPRPNKQIVAFKVEPELAALLDAMPNKSEFIRNAVARQLSTACPLCRGTGITPYTADQRRADAPRAAASALRVRRMRREGSSSLPHAGALRRGAAHRVVRAVGRLLLRGLRPDDGFLRRLSQSDRAGRGSQEAGVRGVQRGVSPEPVR